MNKRFLNLLFAGLGLLILDSCKKNNVVIDQDVVPPTFAKFNTLLPKDTIATYFVRSTEEPFKLPVGITTVSSSPRTVNFTYTSRTAVRGVQYNAPASITIPAGSALDTLVIKGVYSSFTSLQEIDTVKISIGGTEIPGSPYKGTFYLIIRKQCEVNLTDLLGDYTRTNEMFASAYGPYTTSISSAVTLTPTTGTIVVENIWDNGWGPITFNLDWSDPANKTVKAVAQPSIPGSDAGDFNPAYAGLTIAERPFATGNLGTFNTCDNTLTLKMQLGVTGLGYYPNVYTVTMQR